MVHEADEIDEVEAYSILGLQPGATQLEIKQAYRRQARQTHPDAHPNDPHATLRFRRVHAAYNVLRGETGPVRRRVHWPRRRGSTVFNEARRAEELARTTNVAVLRRAATMPSALFAAAIARNPRCPIDLLAQLAAAGHWTVDLAIARRPDAPADLLMSLGHTHDRAVALALASNPASPPELLDLLAVRARWPEVRRAVAEHPACPPATLALLSRTNNVDTLIAVLNNDDCPVDVRQNLTRHRASAVASAARSALARDGYARRKQAASAPRPEESPADAGS